MRIQLNSVNENFPDSIIFLKTNARSTLWNAFFYIKKNNAYKGLPCSYTAEFISPPYFFTACNKYSQSYYTILQTQ